MLKIATLQLAVVVRLLWSVVLILSILNICLGGKMLANWSDKKIEWYVRASKWTCFHQTLADRIRPFLKKTDHVVDLGCGPGLIDMAIAADVNKITAIDINPTVLGHYNNVITEEKHTNIRTLCGDAKTHPEDLIPEEFDVALFCFFGGPHAAFKTGLRKASRITISITHGIAMQGAPSIISGEFQRAYEDEMETYLTGEGIRYTKMTEWIDFSQPLLSMDEAECFFKTYASEGEEGSVERKAQIARQLSLVKKTDDPIFPLLFNKPKDTAIFIIEK